MSTITIWWPGLVVLAGMWAFGHWVLPWAQREMRD